MTDKAELRDLLRRARRVSQQASDAPGRADRADRIARAVLAQPEVADRLSARPAPAVAVYASLQFEPPTDALRRRLREAGHRVLLPVAEPDGRLGWVIDHGAEATAWGVSSADPAIGHPPVVGFGARLLIDEQVAVLLLPALAATVAGDRLGQGGGYYDRLLAELPGVAGGGPLRVCLVGTDELLDELPKESHDEPVDVVVTA